MRLHPAAAVRPLLEQRIRSDALKEDTIEKRRPEGIDLGARWWLCLGRQHNKRTREINLTTRATNNTSTNVLTNEELRILIA